MSFGSGVHWGRSLGPVTSLACLCWLLLLFKSLFSSLLKLSASRPHVNIRRDTALHLGSLSSWWLRMTKINTLHSWGLPGHRLLWPTLHSILCLLSFCPSPGFFLILWCGMMHPSLHFLPILMPIIALFQKIQSKYIRNGIHKQGWRRSPGDRIWWCVWSITWEGSSLAAMTLPALQKKVW